MADAADRRGEMIKLLEEATMIAEELKDGSTAYLIERAVDGRALRCFGHPADTR